MVLYHANGRVVEAHEDYLEQQAHKVADDEYHRYVDQIDICNQRADKASSGNVTIIIDPQKYRTLYCERAGDSEDLEAFKQDISYTIPTTVDRNTLKTCSTFAEEHFTYNPGNNELHLPICYPRWHLFNMGKLEPDENNQILGYDVLVDGRKLVKKPDAQMAFIRPEEIEKYIIPWLGRVQKQFEKAEATRSESSEESETHTGEPTTRPKRAKLARYLVSRSGSPIAMGIPRALGDKIHLYNAMLQLGLPKFVQLPLIDALVLQMYQTELKACHLDILEHTIGRFYSRGVAVLDPVLCHLIGTYSFRSLGDHKHPTSPGESDTEPLGYTDDAVEGSVEESDGSSTELRVGQATDDERTDGTSGDVVKEIPEEDFDFKAVKRVYLDYIDLPAGRANYPSDTYLLPPELPVLGHSIRHWSGVRRNQSTAAAHTGFPLNIGKYKKFIRRNSTDALNVEDYFEEETNRLAGQEKYQEHGPGKGN